MTHPVHPGRVLREEIEERGLSGIRLAHALGVPANRIGALRNGKRAITADTALRLARYFGAAAQFWLDLQSQYDLARAEAEHGAEIRRSVRAA